MSDYLIVLGWGLACIVAGLVAMMGKVEKIGGGGQRNGQLSNCVEVRG